MIKIVKQLVPEDKYYLKCPNEIIPTRIVVHNTENDISARDEIIAMINNVKEASFHYVVDDKEIVQSIPENRGTLPVKNIDEKETEEGITIEICHSKSGGYKFIKAKNNSIELIVDILNRYSWDIDKVTKHQDYSSKNCPRKILDLEWDRFINDIKEKLSQIRTRPFLLGDIIYNTKDLYLHETAGYGGKETLLKRNTKSIVKKYHYNNGLYMALGQENSYYDIAWTDEYSKFAKVIPIVEQPSKIFQEENKETKNKVIKENKHTKDTTKKIHYHGY